MKEIPTVEELTACFRQLPGIGSKTAERLAYATLNLTSEERAAFERALEDVDKKVHRCPNCGLFYEDVCPVCSDPSRNPKQVLVVSQSKDIYSIERTKSYHGTYFTLNGTLSMLHNRTPEEIGIPRLIERIERDGVEEVILALPTDLDGETTSLYLQNRLKGTKTRLTRLAYGIPVGTNLEYLDNQTIAQSLEGRRDVSQEKKDLPGGDKE